MDKNFLSDIILKLKKRGCDQSDIFFVKNFSMSSSKRLGKIEKNEQSENVEIGIRAIIGKKQSIISSNNLDLNNIDKLLDRLYEMVSHVPENNYCGLAEESSISNFSQKEFELLDLFDGKIPKLSELTCKAEKLESSALENKFITNSEGAEVEWSKSDYFLLGSNGITQQFSKTQSSYILAILAGKDDNMERAYDYKSEVYFDDLDNLEQVGIQTAERAIKKLNSRKIQTTKSNVIFDSRISSSLLNNLINACNAISIARGTSFLKNKLDKRIFSKDVNIVDNPSMKRKIKSKIIDCEGIKCKKKNIVENGYLKYFINSLEQSRQLKSPPTGNASRSVSSVPYPSATNLYLDKGPHTKKNIIKNLKTGLLVTELMGSSVNLSNGDYSRGASGFWIENGEIQYPVSEVTIAGNLLDMFKRLIPANDLTFKYGINAPSCLIENLTIAGI